MLSPLPYNFECSLNEGSSSNLSAKSDHLLKIICAGHNFEKRIYIVQGFPYFTLQSILILCKLSLDTIDTNNDEQDKLFTMYSINTMHSSHLAAKNCIRQYTQFVALLKHDEDAWAQRLQEAGYVVMEQGLCRVALNGIEVEDDEQDMLLKCTADTVFSNYIAAQHRVRQYTQFLTILKGEEEAWAQRFQKATCVMPDYQPRCQCQCQ
jgi:hypothetical protein